MKIQLRKWEKKDAPQLVLIANNKQVSDTLRDRFPYPYLLKDADTWIGHNWKVDPSRNFAIEADGLLVGGCGLELKEDVYRFTAEIGYWIGEPFWKQGIATQCVSLLLEIIGRDFPQIKRVVAEVFASNRASMSALLKNGFHLESIRRKAIFKHGTLQDDQVWVKLLA